MKNESRTHKHFPRAHAGRLTCLLFFTLFFSLLTMLAVGAVDTTPPIVITPPADVKSIEISSAPQKTEYFVGEKLSLDGAKIKIEYSEGESQSVKIDSSWVEYDFSAAGEKTVTVSYQGRSCTFTVIVKEVEVTSIKITKQPKKTEYFVGDTIDTEGLAVTAYYNNGDKKDVTPEIIMTGLDCATAGEKTVSVFYGTFSDTFILNITEPTVSEMSITSMPKTEYYDGEEFSAEGCTVVAVYNSGVSETLTEGFTFSGFDSSRLGEQEITLQYGGFSITFTVTVSLSPNHAHTPLPAEHTVLPTCTECGLDTVKCVVCGETIDQRSVAPTGHSFTEFTVITYPTAHTAGLQNHSCKTCGFSENLSIDKLTNRISNGTFAVELLGEGAVFPYLARLEAQDVTDALTAENIDELNRQLSYVLAQAKLMFVINADILLADGEKFVPDCDVKITYYHDEKTDGSLYSIIDGKVTKVSLDSKTVSLTDAKTGQFLIFSSSADETAASETTALPTDAPEDNNNGTVALLVAAIAIAIVLIIVISVYVVKKFYW